MANLNLHTILEYYAILCLVMSPVSIAMFVFLYRKTNIVDRIERLVDRILGIKTEQKPEPKTNTGAPEKDIKNEEHALELSGIACFTMQVGDTYHCRKGNHLFNEGLHDIVWNCDNEFLGEINEEGLFTSKKAGTVNIYCARKDEPFASSIHSYSIRVKPYNENWFAQWMIDAVSQKTSKANILAQNIKMKISRENPETGILEYQGDKLFKEVILQFDSMNCLERGLFILKGTHSALLQKIQPELRQRFELVQLKNNTATNVWVHRLTDETKDEVDIFAYVRNSIKGETVLGFSQNWREYGDIEEFLLNLDMAEKVFSDCLPDYEPERLIPADENPVYMKKDNNKENLTEIESKTIKKEYTEVLANNKNDYEETSIEEEDTIRTKKTIDAETTNDTNYTEGNDGQEEQTDEADLNNDYEQFDDYSEE